MYTSVLTNNQIAKKTSDQNFVDQSTKTIFCIVFFLVFCFSGALTMVGVFPYRMALASLFVMPLIIVRGVHIDKVFVTYLLLTTEVVISGIYNESSLNEIMLFLRIPIFSYLIYYITERYITSTTIVTVINWCIRIGIIQLPLVFLQQETYALLPPRITNDLLHIDCGFGTFNYKGDYAMGFFLLALLVYLLFDERTSHAIKYKFAIILWFSITVLVTNSEMNKLILVLIWVIYFITKTNLKTIIQLFSALLLIIAILSATGYLDNIMNQSIFTLQSTQRQLSGGSNDVDAFLRGQYSRGAAIYYYLNHDILWLGDGPSRYSNALTGELARGNTGHIFTFYSEIGLLGWLGSITILFFIIFNRNRSQSQTYWVPVLIFLAVQMLSFTNQVMNDISIVMTCCIIAKTHLIRTFK